MSKKGCFLRKNGSVSRGKRKQKKFPEPSALRGRRVPKLYLPRDYQGLGRTC